MFYNEYCNLRTRKKPRKGHNQHNFDLLCKLGKITISQFDGSNMCTSQAWVHKLDNYFQLNPMTEVEAINFSTLHLDGEAHEWWYHGLLTLGHSNITSYDDFTQRLMDMFDRMEPKIQFRELEKMWQTTTPKAFVIEFQQMAIMVTDVSEHRLVMLFMEGLVEPLRGWVKDFRPNTLNEAIVKTWDIVDRVPIKTLGKKIIPQKGQVSKPP
jgi:hypothetical protein